MNVGHSVGNVGHDTVCLRQVYGREKRTNSGESGAICATALAKRRSGIPSRGHSAVSRGHGVVSRGHGVESGGHNVPNGGHGAYAPVAPAASAVSAASKRSRRNVTISSVMRSGRNRSSTGLLALTNCASGRSAASVSASPKG